MKTPSSSPDDDGDFDQHFQRPNARSHDHQTSKDAARDATLRASRGRKLVLWTLRTRLKNATDYDLADFTGWQQNSIGKRRLECQRAGFVEQVFDEFGFPVKRPAPSGSNCLVWKITPKGVAISKLFPP